MRQQNTSGSAVVKIGYRASLRSIQLYFVDPYNLNAYIEMALFMFFKSKSGGEKLPNRI